MLAQRVASAAVAIPAIVLFIWAGGPWYTAAVCLIVLVAAYEFQTAHRGRWTPLGLVAAGLVAALPAGASVGLDWLLWFTMGGMLIPLVWVTIRAEPETALTDWTWAVSGLAYVGLLGAHLVLLRELSEGRDWVYLTVFATFAVDTAAYAVGRTVGRRKLAPRISPGKTVEGTLGGLAGGFAMVLLLNYFLGIRLEAALIVPLAALLPVAAVLGDLAESILKRGMQVKDASSLIPGHGGLLDRFDSLLFTFPVVYYFVTWVVP
ncbi:MAG: phosphatidate cytidylyltransferase [Chloroflexi bacterium]|nr:phosphatidate cytidylyltransferase [Chloroflexota bacterium]